MIALLVPTLGKPYRLKSEAFGHVAGTLVYKCRGFDYGCANDDSRLTGIEHFSMTLNADGSYPSFTVAWTELEQVGEQFPDGYKTE